MKVGVEGTGAYGAGLARHLAAEGVEVVEVNRPNRQARRRRGKSNTVDAEAAARAALNGEATVIPKAQGSLVESIRVLRVAFTSARHSRTRVTLQVRDLVVTASDVLRDALGTLTARANPALRGAKGVGPDTAAIVLSAAGDNPGRLKNEAAIAAMCGVSPFEASSGKTVRHRLNRSGNRQANHALWRIVMVRISFGDPATMDYVERRTKEGKTMCETVRCLKRHVAREVYRHLMRPEPVPVGAELRAARLDACISLQTVAGELGSSINQISRLERALVHDTALARRYEQWLQSLRSSTAEDSLRAA